MSEVVLRLPEEEAKDLYRHLHLVAGGQDSYWEAYRQLQSHFFSTLTVEQITALLGVPE
jgi:hypothetical protein